MTKLNSKSSTDRLRLYSGVHWIEREYDPNETYYFVDYDDLEECRWVREGYCDSARLRVLLANLPYARDWEQGGKLIPLFKDLRVTPEDHLEELKDGEWDEELKKYHKDTITNRVYYFDGRYEVFSEFAGGREPLTKKKDETQEQWELRVIKSEEEKKERRKKEVERDMELHDRVNNQKLNNNGTLHFVWGGYQVGDDND